MEHWLTPEAHLMLFIGSQKSSTWSKFIRLICIFIINIINHILVAHLCWVGMTSFLLKIPKSLNMGLFKLVSIRSSGRYTIFSFEHKSGIVRNNDLKRLNNSLSLSKSIFQRWHWFRQLNELSIWISHIQLASTNSGWWFRNQPKRAASLLLSDRFSIKYGSVTSAGQYNF